MSSICSTCQKHVKTNHRKLICTVCKHYIHKKCSNLTNKEFNQKYYVQFWHCDSCNTEIGLPFNHIEDENKFLLEIYRVFENENTLEMNTKNKYEHLSFDPTLFLTDFSEKENNSDSPYFTEANLSQFLNQSKSVHGISMLNLNIRSLDKNFDSFRDFLHSSNMSFDIIGLDETWLKNKPLDYFMLNGYNLEFKNRDKKRGGGVCLYIRDDIKYHVRDDLNNIKNPEFVDSLFIEIEKSGSKNIVIGIMYRPPGQDLSIFNEFFDKVLTHVSRNQKLVYLMGDFNVNLLNEDTHSHTNDFINTLTSHSFYPSITKPTRITSRSASLIDNIFTNSKAYQTSGIVISDISDHLPIFIKTNLTIFRNQNAKSEIEIREYTSANVENFKKELNNVDWTSVCNQDDVNVSYSNFINKFNEQFDKCIPKKMKRINSKKNKPKLPWITTSLLKSIKRKNKLFKISIKKPTDTNIEKYKSYRNKLNSVLRLAKSNYYSVLLNQEKNNMRNTWKILNSIIRSNTNKSKCSEKFVSENETFTCPLKISTEFNKYFANIGPSLASTIKHSGKDFSDYLHESYVNNCFFRPTSEDEILKIIKKFGNGKSPGHDKIKIDLVKQIANEIAYPLKLIINTSLSTGIVPDEFKIAKVIPIYKKDNPEMFGNYRPVSVLPCLSKVLERIVYNRSYDFLTKYDILYKKQYGFRTNHSTYMAVLDFINSVGKAVDEGMLTVGVFMDLSKAFDTIDHNVLLYKLNHYGFRGVCNKWFQNYLSNRKQYVSYNSAISSLTNVSCGVPQGSILGPLLFIIYMNDICQTSKLLSTILFADDTTVFYSHQNLSVLCSTLNRELKEVSNWFKANKLSLNAKKTNLMYLGTRSQTNIAIDNNYFDIYLDGCKLTRVFEAKFLGIIIDENMTWKKHIDNVCKICSRNIGVLNKVKLFLPTNALYKLYCTLLLPYFNYGLLLWGNSTKDHINKVFRLQKRAMRIISNSGYLTHTKPIFKRFNTLNIFDMYNKETAIFMFKYKNFLLPKSFENIFSIHRESHDYYTRNRDDFKIPMQKIENVFKIGPKIWNELPHNIKISQTLNQFKSNLKDLF